MVAGRVDLGELEIPIAQIVGMNTAGRQTAFAANFMPLLDLGTEFASKWISLCEAHLGDTGIVDPIRCFEYMGQFYVQEGNKRVSVPAELRRADHPRVRHARAAAVLRRPRLCGSTMNSCIFMSAAACIRCISTAWATIRSCRPRSGFDAEHVWSQLERRAFLTAFYTFKTAYDKLTQSAPPVTTAERC